MKVTTGTAPCAACDGIGLQFLKDGKPYRAADYWVAIIAVEAGLLVPRWCEDCDGARLDPEELAIVDLSKNDDDTPSAEALAEAAATRRKP